MRDPAFVQHFPACSRTRDYRSVCKRMMLLKWYRRYELAMNRTRFLSQTGSFLLSLFAFLQILGTYQALQQAENIHEELWEAALRITAFHFAIGATFAIRFVLLLFPRRIPLASARILWLIGCCQLGIYWAINRDVWVYDDPPFVAFNYPRADPLVAAAGLYLAASFVRLAVTIAVSYAAAESDELNPYS